MHLLRNNTFFFTNGLYVVCSMDLRRLLISFILIQLKGDFFFKNASFKFMI